MKKLLALSAAVAAALALGACHKGSDVAGNVTDVASDANATAAEAVSDTNAAESDAAAAIGNEVDSNTATEAPDVSPADNGN
jgi:hypothetical protein